MKYTDILQGIQEQLKSTLLPQPTVQVDLGEDGSVHNTEPLDGVMDKNQNQKVAESQKKKIEELRSASASEAEQANENETPEIELMEYKKDFLDMNIGSLNAIMQHAKSILESLDNPMIKNNLTESWLQGKIAITEDYMRTIHDFVKYVPSDDDDTYESDKAGLWENIRKKKLREGKNYKPAKPGDKDRPDPDAWKKAQK